MSKYIPGNQKHLTLEDRKYKECLSQSRAGINMTRHELHQEDMVITPLIFQGQSPYLPLLHSMDIPMLVQFLNPETCFHTLYTHNNRTALCHPVHNTLSDPPCLHVTVHSLSVSPATILWHQFYHKVVPCSILNKTGQDTPFFVHLARYHFPLFCHLCRLSDYISFVTFCISSSVAFKSSLACSTVPPFSR